MLKGKTVAVVVPAYNEEKQISLVLDTMPGFVDRIIVVNDCSKDNTAEVVRSYHGKFPESELTVKPKTKIDRYSKADELIDEWNKKEVAFFKPAEIVHPHKAERLVLINMKQNAGVGGAIARGYKWAKDHDISCTAVMAGDGQMDPSELEKICKPVIEGEADYVKGNRLSHKSARILIPKTRFFGNSILSILTKIASGFWHVSDTQTGYTAISNDALNAIKLFHIYPGYGMPNDMLVKLNISNCTLKEINIKPVYDVGENSKLKIYKVIPKISWLLIKSFFKRIYSKYLYRSFHPLFILYHFGFFLLVVSVPFGLKILKLMLNGINANPVTVLGFVFLFISGFQSLLFAMWMDIQDNERLYK